MSQSINTLYDFLLQQMAAESYIEKGYDKEEVSLALKMGANRQKTGDDSLNQGYAGFTRMADVQVAEFLKKFQVVHQWSDNPGGGSRPQDEANDTAAQKLNVDILANTGLSATLTRRLNDQGLPTDQYTLSIRSTEFLKWADGGDRERDGWAQDLSGVVLNGFALAQLSALEKYYGWLKETGKLPSNAKLNVTGFSLGGHLAMVFTEMHKDDPNLLSAVTFNGAGRGTWDESAGSLKDMIDYFDRVMNDPTSLSAEELYELNIPEALYSLVVDAERLSGQEFPKVYVYSDPRYQLAAYLTKLKFGLGVNAPGSEASNAITNNKLTQIRGFELINNVDFTVNSGVHVKSGDVGIESQPLYDLDVTWPPKKWLADFGQAHSITLIADSLAVQRLLFQLDSSYTQLKFIDALGFSTHKDPNTGFLAKYEDNALENILDGLRRFIQGPDVEKTEFNDNPGGFGDLPKREFFYNNIKALAEDPVFLALKDKIIAVPANDGSTMAARARIDFTALLSLLTLSPIRLAAKPGMESEVEMLLATQWEEEHEGWKHDLDETDRGREPDHYTQKWMEDRSFLLGSVMLRNANNIDPDAPENEFAEIPAAHYLLKGAPPTIYLKDITSNTKLKIVGSTLGNGSEEGVYYTFGSSDAEQLQGDGLSDHLYGEGGDDFIYGQDGNDYIEGGKGADDITGGKGNDTLIGGAGFDVYRAEQGDGIDRIRDADGVGELWIDGVDAAGGAMAFTNQTELISWSKAGGRGYRIQYAYDTKINLLTISSGNYSVVIEDFTSGNFGIQAPTSVVVEKANEGNLLKYPDQLYSLAFLEQFRHWDPEINKGARNVVYDLYYARKPTDANKYTDVYVVGDFYVGGLSRLPDHEYNVKIRGLMREGNDLFEGGISNEYDSRRYVNRWQYFTAYGRNGDDQIYAIRMQRIEDALITTEDVISESTTEVKLSGGQGDDTVVGAAGDDFLLGGDGNDVLVGGAGVDVIYSDQQLVMEQLQADAHNEWGASKGADPVAWKYFHGENKIIDGKPQFVSLKGCMDPMYFLGNSGGLSHYEFAGPTDGVRDPENGPALGSGDDTVYAGSGGDYVETGLGHDIVYAGAGNDAVGGCEGNDIIYGEEGNDLLFGDMVPSYDVSGLWHGLSAGGPVNFKNIIGVGYDFSLQGNDFIDGGEGDDYISGGGGSDVIKGGAGVDTLIGGSGDDVFAYQLGDGSDVITVVDPSDVQEIYYSGRDTIIFGDLVNPGDLSVSMTRRVSSGEDAQANPEVFDFEVRLADGAIISLKSSAVRTLKFSKTGDQWLLEDLISKSGVLTGGDGNDQITGTDNGDDLGGGAGEDVLEGGKGNDVLAGGKGDDVVIGGFGHDVINYGLGDGHDVVRGGSIEMLTLESGGLKTYLPTQGADDVLSLGHDIPPDSVRVALTGRRTETTGFSSNPILINELDFTLSFADGGSLALESSAVRAVVFESDATVWDMRDLIRQSGMNRGTSDNDDLDGTDFDDVIEGQGGYDTLYGGQGNDFILGGDGSSEFVREFGSQWGYFDDDIDGGVGDDTIDGGNGSDYLKGGIGNDTYILKRGSGWDDIFEERNDNFDVIAVRGVEASDVTLSWARGVQINGTNDAIRFDVNPDLNQPNRYGIEAIRFDDGSTWDRAAIVNRLNALTQSNDEYRGDDASVVVSTLGGDDMVRTGAGNDSVYGGSGNDTIMSGAGADVVAGGSGNDVFSLGLGRDVIHYGWGDGDDEYHIPEGQLAEDDDFLVFGAGVSQNDIELWTGANQELIVINRGEGGGSLTFDGAIVVNAWGGLFTGYEFIDRVALSGIKFADGGFLSREDLISKVEGRYLFSSHYQVYSGSYNSVLPTKYHYNVGFGADQASLRGRSVGGEVYEFGVGIDPSDVSFIKSPSSYGPGSLIIKVGKTGDQIVIGDWYDWDENSGEPSLGDLAPLSVEFSNGVIWSAQDVQAKAEAAVEDRPIMLKSGTGAPFQGLNLSRGSEFIYGFAQDAMVDPDPHDIVSYTVTMADAQRSPLPAWLSFDASTRTLRGTPPADAPSSLNLYLTGRSGNLGLLAPLKLNIASNGSKAPVLNTLLPDQVLGVAGSLSFVVPSSAFVDPEGGALTYAVTLGNGNSLTGSWLRFDAATRTLTGQPLEAGLTSVKVTATDGSKLFTSDVFDIQVLNLGQLEVGDVDADSLVGGAGDDTLQGMDGMDTLSGGGGADRLEGGQQDDVYVVTDDLDSVIEQVSEGVDTVQASIGFRLPEFVENLDLRSATGRVNGWGNEDTNTIHAGDHGGVVRGLGGNDLLISGSSDDSLLGGLGDDTYVVNSGSDEVVEFADQGHDVVESSVSYTLRENMEQLTLLGSADINGVGTNAGVKLVGNTGKNQLTGGAGTDVLDGGTGIDTLIGSLGNDLYIVTSTYDPVLGTDVWDVVLEEALTSNPLAGLDTVQTEVSGYHLPENVENLVLTGKGGGLGLMGSKGGSKQGFGNSLNNVLTGSAGDEELWGMEGDDSLQGGAGADTLDGGIGWDQLEGGAGDDIYRLSNDALDAFSPAVSMDTIIEVAGSGGGSDTVETSINGYRLAENVEVLKTSALIGYGNALNNSLIGSDLANHLYGEGGDDALQGLAGADVLEGGAGNNTYDGGLGDDLLIASDATSSDHYIWGRDQGADTLFDAGGADVLQLLPGVEADQLWFSQTGNSLRVSVVGSSDSFTIDGWFLDVAHQVELIKLDDGRAVNALHVQTLVDAMAAFAPPAAGASTWTPEIQSQLAPVVANAWVG